MFFWSQWLPKNRPPGKLDPDERRALFSLGNAELARIRAAGGPAWERLIKLGEAGSTSHRGGEMHFDSAFVLVTTRLCGHRLPVIPLLRIWSAWQRISGAPWQCSISMHVTVDNPPTRQRLLIMSILELMFPRILPRRGVSMLVSLEVALLHSRWRLSRQYTSRLRRVILLQRSSQRVRHVKAASRTCLTRGRVCTQLSIIQRVFP